MASSIQHAFSTLAVSGVNRTNILHATTTASGSSPTSLLDDVAQITSFSVLANSSSTTSSAKSVATGSSTLPACNEVQYTFATGEGQNAERAAAVKEAYLWGWNAYEKYAFGSDELQPLTQEATDNWYGWGVTIVDGIDTAIVMNLTDVVEKQLSFISTVDFTTPKSEPVELFDTNIRYLGGLLSAYDLLVSGQYGSYDKHLIDALLSQAVVLADKLAFGFNTSSGLSSANVDFSTNMISQSTYTVGNTTYYSVNTAQAGTFLVEWYRLASLTGNTTYRSLVDKGESYLVNPSPAAFYPGLPGTQFGTTHGNMLNYGGGWHSEVDSFLEYLIKAYHYTADKTTSEYANFWLAATNSTEAYLAQHPYGWPDLTFISYMDDSGTLTGTMDDYSCFAGGNFLLGCKVLDEPWLCDLGIAASDGCHQTYNTTITGLGGFYWGWYNSSDNTQSYYPEENTDAAARKQASKDGYFVFDGDEGWSSFPEAIESWFHAYRITGEERWADYVWEVFLAINETARNDVAFASVGNSNMPFGGSQSNSLDSFFFAEVLKYIYLTFAGPDVVNLNEWVFNTECHPVRALCR
jgi:mannosyl-oligosaccharide alpha-1,2-mannosidase